MTKDPPRLASSMATGPEMVPVVAPSTEGTRFQNWCRRRVLDLLGSMPHGRLRLRLPEGEECVVGSESAAGIQAEVRIRNPRFFSRVILGGDIGLGEAYMDGDWDSPDLVKVIGWFILNIEANPVLSGGGGRARFFNWLGGLHRTWHRLRDNTPTNSRRNIREHYDLGNHFYECFLDRSMTYSCGLFRSGHETLEEAQAAKYERLCQQLRLGPGVHVLEIGSGWGGFAEHAARHHGCRVTGVTISQAQLDYARERIRRAGLHEQVTFELKDYRDLTGSYDRIVSIEMLEAVGDAFLETFFAKCHAVLKPDGLMALQFITCPDCRFESFKNGVDFIQRHVFPGSLLNSIGRVNQALLRTGDFFLHDLRDLGDSYPLTLAAWRRVFHERAESIRELGFDEEFLRKWHYYFCYCEAAFRRRNISVVQALYTRPNNPLLALD